MSPASKDEGFKSSQQEVYGGEPVTINVLREPGGGGGGCFCENGSIASTGGSEEREDPSSSSLQAMEVAQVDSRLSVVVVSVSAAIS